MESNMESGTLFLIMIYNGKEASLALREILKARVTTLTQQPTLAVFSIAEHPSITSFIKIKRTFGETIGVKIDEYSYDASFGEAELIKKIDDVSLSGNFLLRITHKEFLILFQNILTLTSWVREHGNYFQIPIPYFHQLQERLLIF